jgi:hypothetical protein
MCAIAIQDPEGGVRQISFPANLRPAEVISLAFPALRPIIPYLFLVRSCGPAQLRITNPRVPLSLYTFPGAEWSLKLRYLPTIPLPESVKPLVLNFVKELSMLNREFERYLDATNDRLLRNPLFTSRRFDTIRMKSQGSQGGRVIVVASTNEWTAVTSGEASYYVIPTSDLALDLSVQSNGAEIPMLVCGQNAVPLEPLKNPQKMLAFLPVLAMAGGEILGGEEAVPERGKFEALVGKSMPAYISGTNPRLLRAPPDPGSTLDEQLAELRKVRAKAAIFERI